jgi:hypothetical protein
VTPLAAEALPVETYLSCGTLIQQSFVAYIPCTFLAYCAREHLIRDYKDLRGSSCGREEAISTVVLSAVRKIFVVSIELAK